MIFDLHCDTFLRMYCDKDEIDTFKKSRHHIDIDKLKRGNVFAQCFAIFNEKPKDGYKTEEMYDKIEYMFSGLNKFSDDIYLYKGYDDLINSKPEDKICAIPTIEDLGPILGDIDHIYKLHNMNFKIMSLIWNYENTLAFPNSMNKEIMGSGLKRFGFEAVELMNELGMIVDVSHLSDGGFYDVARTCKRPFVATHSNARSVTNHQRNLTDDMIKILSDAGGVTGINFCPRFLFDDSTESRVEDMIRHIEHIRNVGGVECIAIGSDFDGISGELEIYDASQYNLLIEGLVKAGFTQSEIDKITYQNALRVFKDSE